MNIMNPAEVDPIPYMYGIFIYIYLIYDWLIFIVNLGKYTIHQWIGMES